MGRGTMPPAWWRGHAALSVRPLHHSAKLSGPPPHAFGAGRIDARTVHRYGRTKQETTAMTKTELAAKMNDAGAWLPGKTVKLDFGDDGVIMLDGQANQATEADGPADTTIKVSWADWQSMIDGQLDGMTAFMTGKLKVEGDMSNAMQLQGVVSKLRG